MYSGHVSPGGPPAVRELAELIVNKVSVGGSGWDNNAYVLRCRDTGEELLIDAADEPERILTTCGEGPLVRIVTTHRHRDHWRALAEVVERTEAITVAHADDAPAISVPTAEEVRDGDRVRFGRIELEVIHLVGHTPGSIALLYDDPTGSPHLWTGDSLFPGGVGKTTSPENFASLIGDVERKLFGRLPDETWVYPGHGDDTTLGHERPHLAEWRSRGW
ncbi:MBL fold metallo-hydrolase [Phytoactinopolyspora halotolerans]|uniref:MBL fold metallo-hydrolase n=1 Tax=Phytoactinopolyspora halotolerans TaxID=1981512 RepID=A0A6L9SAM9_9ACTN|nr:MBL fold metallo-hydrolase [Phytoactinopolyspora halotolerans]NEE02197.1 MBL fold metallo-hydrolase [Phytoactinopolyspora halotolerans]